MTRKRRRMIMVLGGVACLGTAVGLVLNAFSDNLVFFYSPSDLAAKHPAAGRALRIGGLVETGTVVAEEGGSRHRFKVTDGTHDVEVEYVGVLPDLFREGQGVIAEGKVAGDNLITASSILAKHDERYMPKEVADALKKSGQWRGDEAASAPATPAMTPSQAMGPAAVPQQQAARQP